MELVPALSIFLVGLAIWGFTTARHIDDGQVEAVARMYSVPLSPPVIDRLRRRLLLVRRWRLVGALAGAAIGVVVAVVTTIELTVNVLLFSIAVGFAVAATGFELADARRSTSARRTVVTARPRTLRNIVSFWAVAPCAAAIVIVAAALVVSAIWPPRSGTGALIVEPLDPVLLGGLAGLFVVAVLLGAVAVRLVVLAGERGVDAADVVVLRATRLTAVMTVVGATWMSVGAIGVVVVQPLWNVQVENGLLSGLRIVPVLYVALSPMAGFIATVTAVPRRPRGRSGAGDVGDVDRSVGQLR